MHVLGLHEGNCQACFPPRLVSWLLSIFPTEAEQGEFNACFSSLLQRTGKLA